MNLIILILFTAGLAVLIASMFTPIADAHSIAMCFFSFPAGYAAGTAIAKLSSISTKG